MQKGFRKEIKHSVNWSRRIKQLQKKQRKTKLRVGFPIIYGSAFQAFEVIEAFRQSSFFEPVVFLAPDTLRGESHMLNTMDETRRLLNELGYEPLEGMDAESGLFVDFSSELDLVCITNPYEELTHSNFTTEHFARAGVIPIYLGYGPNISNLSSKSISQNHFRFFWKIFVSTRFEKDAFAGFNFENIDAVEVVGSTKFDEFPEVKQSLSDRKLVIFAPHHTIGSWKEFKIGHFQKYSENIITIAKQFNDIDFVFRPHPLLRTALEREDSWGEQLTAQYFDRLRLIPNIQISTDSDYLRLFSRSDALIHDSGSFLMQYLVTGKPAAFFVERESDTYATLNGLGQRCLDFHYLVSSEQDMVAFINQVVVMKRDPLMRARVSYSEHELRVNFGHASQHIVERIVDEMTKA